MAQGVEYKQVEAGSAAIRWPTVALALVVYGGWIVLTWWETCLPTCLVVALGAWLIAWHSSLQHEVIHGHPTGSAAINAAIGFPPLGLWLPFARYRDSHLAHHRDGQLTDPLEDPESAYWTAAAWRRQPVLVRRIVAANATLFGRLTIGPFWTIGRFLLREGAAIGRGEEACLRTWPLHLVAVLAVLGWVSFGCGIAPWRYAAEFVLPGLSLTLLRSFAEHRAAGPVACRTAVIEAAPLLGLLYLNNNLHVVHHARPGLPWYRIPGWYRTHRARLLRQNGGLVYRGYAEVFARFLLTPHDELIHPLRGSTPAKADATPIELVPPASSVIEVGG